MGGKGHVPAAHLVPGATADASKSVSQLAPDSVDDHCLHFTDEETGVLAGGEASLDGCCT